MKTDSIKSERSLMIVAAVVFISAFAVGVIQHNQSLHKPDSNVAVNETEEEEIELEAWMLDARAWDKNLPQTLQPILPTVELSEKHFVVIDKELVNILAEVEEEPIELESWMLSTRKLEKALGS